MQTLLMMAACLALAAAAGAYPLKPMADSETRDRLRHLLPLPKEVSVTGSITVPARSLRLQLPEAKETLDASTAEELSTLFQEAAGVEIAVGGKPRNGDFTLTFTRSGPARTAIGKVKYPDQAYAIQTARDAKDEVTGLTCTALTDVGLYYAGKTLQQLLRPGIRGKGDAATVSVPAVRVVDWPDLEERGEWGGTCVADLEWMADRKFNLIELHAEITVDKEGVGHAAMKPEVMERARKCGVRIVPIIHHLEQIAKSGVFNAYPQLKAVGAEGSICFAKPEITILVSQWLMELGRTPGVRDVMIWLSEEGKGCACDECKRADRFVNEANVCIAAWERAKQICPALGLRLLLTQASYASNDKVLAAVPEGVKVSYYHGGLTYDTTRRPMIYPLLEEYVKGGRWLGVYPTVSANWLIVAPFSNPAFIHTRMNEFVDKGLRCLVAYAVPANDYYRVNVEGAAEWSWNSKGRSPRESAAAYALRHGIGDPEAFAEWTETLSPVTWNVYGSSFPYREHWGGTEGIARGGAAMGKGIFFEYQREEQLDEDLERCRKALPLAEKTGDPAAVLETRIAEGYVQILKSVWELSKRLKGSTQVAEADREEVRKWFLRCDQGCATVADLYPKWSQAAAPGLTGKEPGRFLDTIQTVLRLSGRMATLMEQCGIPDPNRAYRMHVVGQWKTEEFEGKPGQVRRLDVTEFIDGPGVYLFEPKYRRGTLGLGASRAELVSFDKGNPEETREEAVDAHESHIGAWVKEGVYRLELKAHDPARGYALLAHIRGGKTTEGEFYFRKLRE